MKCPTCKTPIFAAVRDGKIVGSCRMCGMEWTNPNMLTHANETMNYARANKVKADHTTCPFCGSDRLGFGEFIFERIEGCPSMIMRDSWCDDCGHSWRLHYTISDVTGEEG